MFVEATEVVRAMRGSLAALGFAFSISMLTMGASALVAILVFILLYKQYARAREVRTVMVVIVIETVFKVEWVVEVTVSSSSLGSVSQLMAVWWSTKASSMWTLVLRVEREYVGMGSIVIMILPTEIE